MDDTNNHQDLKGIDGSTSTKEGQVEDTAQAEFKQKSSKKLDDIFTGLNQALQELADGEQPLVLIPFESPGPEASISLVYDCNIPSLDDLRKAQEPLMKKIEGHLPLNGQQTVDYLIGLTKDFADHPVYRDSSLDYIFHYATGRLSQLKSLRTEDVIEARKRLGLPTVLIESVTQANKPKPSLPGSPDSSSLGMIKTPTKPGTTVVHAERVIVDNKKMIMILNFENVKYVVDLSNKYSCSAPSYFCFRSGIQIQYLGKPYIIHQTILPGDILSLKEFDKMIHTMKEAAARLSKINKTAKLEKEHSGKFMVNI